MGRYGVAVLALLVLLMLYVAENEALSCDRIYGTTCRSECLSYEYALSVGCGDQLCCYYY
ncbi:hypothetical protein JOB18_000184 [Solea senegalensis]|uniref:Beta-defensin n=1 Tax=Solea senegalensis TaxID=28829 RepID=A0AAV6SQ68_SOLSE|nr:hypothetical protein JOB18_000184 [Solea senegalensis]